MFKRPSIRYGQTPEPATPYQRAAQAWDDRIGSARVQAKNWRLAFFGTLALSGSLAGGLVWQSTRGHIVPWVVQVDRLGEGYAPPDQDGRAGCGRLGAPKDVAVLTNASSADRRLLFSTEGDVI